MSNLPIAHLGLNRPIDRALSPRAPAELPAYPVRIAKGVITGGSQSLGYDVTIRRRDGTLTSTTYTGVGGSTSAPILAVGALVDLKFDSATAPPEILSTSAGGTQAIAFSAYLGYFSED